MNHHVVVTVGAVLGSVLTANGLSGQAQHLVTRAIEAYEQVDFHRAVDLLRRALTEPERRDLSAAEEVRALTFLGAAALMLDRPDSADAAFERLVVNAPRYRPDELVFPPTVLHRFDAVRQRTRVTVLSAPVEAEMRPGRDTFDGWIYASTPHEISAFVASPDGELVRALYSGPVGDSVEFRWDGRDNGGRPVGTGRLFLNVLSLDEWGRPGRVSQLPLDITANAPDTLSHPVYPSDSVFLPEHRAAGPAIQSLVAALGLGTLTATTPSLLGANGSTGTRYLVGSAVSVAGIIGFIAQRPGRELPDNIAVNRTIIAEWRDENTAVQRENRRRRADIRLKIVAREVTRIESEAER